jgi:hypothetical protein
MQVDNPAPTDRALWDWHQNITEGRAVLTTKHASSQTFWNEQVRQFNLYNANPNNIPVGVHDPLDVSDITFSHNPTGTEKPFLDGIWLKQYNGATRGNWMAWKNTNLPAGTLPHWQNNPLNILSRDYVELVLSQRP